MEEKKSNLLSRGDLFSMAVGQIIGVGIMTMTGIAIGFTGRSVNIAYITAGLITIIGAIPQIYIGGTANFVGGQYSQIAVLSGKKMAGIYLYIQLFSALAISMYTLSFADYFLSLVPGVPSKLICTIVLTVLFGMHLLGVKQAARLQNILCAVLAVAIASYIVLGVGHIQPDYFTNGFLAGGSGGFVLASIYLTFAAGGAQYVVNYSSAAKNPTKDIPFVIIASTGIVVLIYAVMATVAVGVLPVEQVANQPLSVSAAAFMPKAVYTFFVVGGAMFALLTTLNFNIGMIVYPVLRACEDGWLPRKLAVKNEKYGSAHYILLLFYLIGTVPILIGLDLNTVANSTVILFTIIRGVIAFSAMQLPKKLPELWGKSSFYVNNGKLKAMCIFSMALAALSVAVLLISTSMVQIIGNIAILIFSIVVALLVNKRVTLNPSFTENSR
ncbi:amino acid permease [Petralouisia muris]|uniref:Amino acid permease n=1 Tax=Petralouisia muris TaxID=3032872 RepID=A0AC61S0F2_9FIRM|nr:APC family permease [Petralouisia muris]TGY97412.1 amino acid permease [Petralouisia muris]